MDHVHLRADDALLAQNIDAVICGLYENHRPLQGTAALIDWRLRGIISRFIAMGKITGAKNELTYIPARHINKQCRLFLLGLGKSDHSLPPQEGQALLDNLKEHLLKLKIGSVALSPQEFSFTDFKILQKSLKGFTVTTIP